MARVLAHKSLNRAFVLILMITLVGWGTTGFGQAVDTSGQNLQGAFNVTVKFDDPNLEGCVSPDDEHCRRGSHGGRMLARGKRRDTASGSRSARAASP